jgi:hypothetical protein
MRSCRLYGPFFFNAFVNPRFSVKVVPAIAVALIVIVLLTAGPVEDLNLIATDWGRLFAPLWRDHPVLAFGRIIVGPIAQTLAWIAQLFFLWCARKPIRSAGPAASALTA